MNRHPELLGLCRELADLRLSLDLECNDRPLLALPMFLWAGDGGASGRKSLREGDQRWLMPARIQWEHGLNVLDPEALGTASFRALAPGIELSGDFNPATGVMRLHQDVPVQIDPVELTDPRAAARRGQAARWAMVERMEPAVQKAVRAAHSSMAAAMSRTLGDERGTWIDEPTVEQIVSRLLLGDGERTASLARWIDLAMDPRAFTRVDPMRHAVVHLRRDARAAVHEAIGDPQAGPAIRTLARQMQTLDVPTLVEEFKRRHPGKRVGERAAKTALNPTPAVALLGLGEM